MGIFSSLLPLCVYSSPGEKGERKEKGKKAERETQSKKYVKEKLPVSVWTKEESSPLRQDGVKKKRNQTGPKESLRS